MTTMADVARLARVSTATVSHVLNGTRPVNATTVEAVRDAIRRTGYTPNSVARSLARASSHTIGVAVSVITNHYFSDVVSAVEAACSRQNFMMFLSDTHDDPEQQFRVVQELHRRRVDGIILAATHDSGEILSYLKSHRVATVLIDRLVNDEFDQVGVENVEATMTLVRHLLGHGHRRIGFIAGKEGVATSAERLEGFSQALRLAGLAEIPDLIECGYSTLEGARQAVHRLLAAQRPPTAVITGNNLMTIGALRALREAGLRVPQDLSLVGFDNFDWAEFATPPLTLMAQPAAELGSVAVDLLMRRLGNPSAPRTTLRLSPQLIVRASCGCNGG